MTKLFVPTGEGGIRDPFLKPNLKDKFWMAFEKLEIIMSSMDFEEMEETDRRQINVLPAMIYHGVRTEEAVLMRMNAVPRSAAEALATLYRDLNESDESRFTVGKTRSFLKGLKVHDWEKVRPAQASLSGSVYKRVWQILSEEAG